MYLVAQVQYLTLVMWFWVGGIQNVLCGTSTGTTAGGPEGCAKPTATQNDRQEGPRRMLIDGAIVVKAQHKNNTFPPLMVTLDLHIGF